MLIVNNNLKLVNSISIFFIIYNIKKLAIATRLALVLTSHKLVNIRLKVLKKKLLFKVAILQLEKLVFKLIGLKTVVNIKNVFTLFKVKSNLKVPKNAVL